MLQTLETLETLRKSLQATNVLSKEYCDFINIMAMSIAQEAVAEEKKNEEKEIQKLNAQVAALRSALEASGVKPGLVDKIMEEAS